MNNYDDQDILFILTGRVGVDQVEFMKDNIKNKLEYLELQKMKKKTPEKFEEMLKQIKLVQLESYTNISDRNRPRIESYNNILPQDLCKPDASAVKIPEIQTPYASYIKSAPVPYTTTTINRTYKPMIPFGIASLSEFTPSI